VAGLASQRTSGTVRSVSSLRRPSQLSFRRLRRPTIVAVLAAAGVMSTAPAAGAVTVTGLGKCTHPQPPYPNLERLTVPGTVTVGADGRPTGASVGISIRNFTMAYEGSGVDLYVDVFDVSSGKIIGSIGTISWGGCARYLWSLRELYAQAPGSVPMTLQRGKLYVVRASGGFVDSNSADPTYGLGALFKYQYASFVAV